MHAVRKLSVWYLHFKILSTRKLKTFFQKYKFVFTTGIHACIDHAFVLRCHDSWQPRKRRMKSELIKLFSVSIVIIPTRLLCQMQANSSGAEFLSTTFKFKERKKILSLLVYVLHKTWKCGSRAVTTKKCTKKRDARAKLLFCLVKRAIAFFTFSSPLHLNSLPIIYDTQWYGYGPVSAEIKQNFLSANCIAPADSIRNVFRLIGSSFRFWWTNRATI